MSEAGRSSSMKRKPDPGGGSSKDLSGRAKKPKVKESRSVSSGKHSHGQVGKMPNKPFHRTNPDKGFDGKKSEKGFDRKKPGKDFDRKKPGKDFDRKRPGKDFDRKEPGKDFDRKESEKDFDRKKPEKGFDREKPKKDFDRKKPEKPYDRKGRKELAESRKQKRKPNYALEKEIKILWEKMRQRSLEKSDRTKLASEILTKMKGKLMEMAGSHIASRVLQAAMKYCEQSERKAAFEELRPHALVLARSTYAHHLVIKMLDFANKSQLQVLLSILHGNIVALLRHPVGSAVVEHAYQLANASQKREMVYEFYSPEYQLFKGLTKDTNRLSELLAKEPLPKQNHILQHLMLSLQPILEKGIVDHSITHRVLAEYLSVCNKKTMVEDVVKSLAGPLLLRICHTKDGGNVAVTCVKLGTAKERKSIIKGMKGHVSKIAQDEHSSAVLMAIMDVVDDTKLVSKIIINELISDLDSIIFHKYGRRCILHLLAPGSSRYFTADMLAALQPSSVQNATLGTSKDNNWDTISASPGTVLFQEKHSNGEVEDRERAGNADDMDGEDNVGNELRGISKKEPSVRRLELVSGGDLGKKLAQACTNQADQLLRSPTGTDVLYEVAMGGVDRVMWQVAPDEVRALHKAVAVLAAAAKRPDAGSAETEHVLEQYHASRTIRRLILNSEPPTKDRSDPPSFSGTLWDTSLKGKCDAWAKGHSAKVISAYRDCRDEHVKSIAEREITRLVKAGLLKADKDKI